MKRISKFYKDAHKEFKDNPYFKNLMLYQSLIHDCYCSIVQAIATRREFYIKRARKFAKKAMRIGGKNELSVFLKKTISALNAGIKGSKGSKFYASYLSRAEKEIKKAIELLPNFGYKSLMAEIAVSVSRMTEDYITKSAKREGPLSKINKRKTIIIVIVDMIVIVSSTLLGVIANKITNLEIMNLDNIPYLIILAGIVITLVLILVPIKDK